MPLITPVKTLGGLAWWTSVRSDSLFILQQHSAPAVWWGKPFRILLCETKICIATCANKDEAFADYEQITKLVEAALPRHLQLGSTALDYENAVLAFLGEYVRRRPGAPEVATATEELLVEENLASPPLSPSRQDDESKEEKEKERERKRDHQLAPHPPPSLRLSAAASAPVLPVSVTPGGEPSLPPIPARVDHLFVLVHGINGKVTDMQDFELHLRHHECFAHNTVIFRSAANQEAGTHQGIELAGNRLTSEIMEILHRIPADQTPRFSIVAHSLGGLISRCAIGKLELLGVFNRLIPTTFMTLCTPHLSSRRVGGVFGHYGKAIWQKMVHYFVQTQGETGKQLLMADCEQGTSPLLQRMTDPDSDYMKALRRFTHPTAIGVTHYDLLVPYASAVMRAHNPHPIPPWNNPNVLSIQDFSNFTDGYLPLFTRFIRRAPRPPALPAHDPPPEDTENGFCCDRLHTVEFTHAMFRNLNTIAWRRLEIQYGGGPQGLHIHEQKWKAPLLNEATATESVSLFCQILRADHAVSAPISAPGLQHMSSPVNSPLRGSPLSVASSPSILLNPPIVTSGSNATIVDGINDDGQPRRSGKDEKQEEKRSNDDDDQLITPKRLIDELREP